MNFKRSKIWACSRLLASSFLVLSCAGGFLNLNMTMMVAHAEGCVFDGNCINRTTYDPETGVLTIPPGYTEIKDLYNRKGIKIVNIPASITKIGGLAFINCNSLTRVNIAPNSELKTIDYDAFYMCNNLKTINLPEGLKEIGDNAFYNCTSLTSISIPSNVITIGDFAFADCTSLREIFLPRQLEGIATGTFSGCSSLENINIPDCVKRIDFGAFSDCTSLKTIALPKELREIGKFAFSTCSSITDINMPDTVSKMDHCVFADCTSLKKVHLSKNLQEIPFGTFRGCSSLEDISVPNKVRIIGPEAFSRCKLLKELYFPPNLEILSYYALGNCNSLKLIKIPDHTKIMDTFFGQPSDLVIGRGTKIERFTCDSQHKCDSCPNLSGISTNVSGSGLVGTTNSNRLLRNHENMPLPSSPIPDSDNPFFGKTSNFNNSTATEIGKTAKEEQRTRSSGSHSIMLGANCVGVAVAALSSAAFHIHNDNFGADNTGYNHGSLPYRSGIPGSFSATRDPWAFLDGHSIVELNGRYYLI